MKDIKYTVIGISGILGAIALFVVLNSAFSQPEATPAERDAALEGRPEVAEAVARVNASLAQSSDEEAIVYKLNAKKVVASELDLVAADGSLRMRLEAESDGFGDGPRIVIYDPHGKIAFEVRSYIHANVIEVHSPNTSDHVEVGASESGGSVVVWKNDTNTVWQSPREGTSQ